MAADRENYDVTHPNELLSFGIGDRDSDFQQLAGRIAFNMAVEGNPGQSLEERFMNAENDNRSKCLVPLRPLGAPKPSAVEMYLTQEHRLGKRTDEGTLCTYGDTPDDRAAGNLRGRKFYLHQPAAATDPKCYELLDRQQLDWASGNSLHIVDKQAMLARFVSQPETEFKFAVRFRDLRGWEFGALLFVLAAQEDHVRQLAASLGLPETAKLFQWLKRIPQWNADPLKRPLLALKLGHGRPLGLGSVRIKVDWVSRLQTKDGMPSLDVGDTEAVCRETVAKLAEKIKQGRSREEIQRWADGVLLPWLQVHRYAGRKAFPYPSAPDKRGDRTIYNYHTNQRRLHAEGRKRPSALGQPLGVVA